MGNKLKARVERSVHFKELIVEGVIGIAEGMNPELIESKLEAFLRGGGRRAYTQWRARGVPVEGTSGVRALAGKQHGQKDNSPKENHDRWLVSYADLVTLLFAFFVVLFASTQTDKTKAKQISEAVERALEHGSAPPRVLAILGGAVDDKGRGNALLRGPAMPKPEPAAEAPPVPHMLDLTSSIQLLRSRLSGETERGAVAIHVEQRAWSSACNAEVFFPVGRRRH